MDKSHWLAAWLLHAMRFKILGNHPRWKIANKCLNVREPVNVAERNEDGPFPFTTALWIVSLGERVNHNYDRKKKQNTSGWLPLETSPRFNIKLQVTEVTSFSKIFLSKYFCQILDILFEFTCIICVKKTVALMEIKIPCICLQLLFQSSPS